MHIPAMIILVLALGVSPLAIAAESDTADKSEGSKGLCGEERGARDPEDWPGNRGHRQETRRQSFREAVDRDS
jgi:hypothetical protein